MKKQKGRPVLQQQSQKDSCTPSSQIKLPKVKLNTKLGFTLLSSAEGHIYVQASVVFSPHVCIIIKNFSV